MADSGYRSSRRAVLMTQLEDRRLLSATVFDVAQHVATTDAAPEPETAVQAPSEEHAARSAAESVPATPRAAASEVIRRFTEVDQSLPGDFNSDGDLDDADIDLLGQALQNDLSDLRYDLNGDGAINLEDADVLINKLLGSEYGDVNLDLRVDHRDLRILRANMFQPVSGWSHGDLNFDGRVDGSDFNVWNRHHQARDQHYDAAIPAVKETMPAVPMKAEDVRMTRGIEVIRRAMVPIQTGDFDRDGDVDAMDIDLLAQMMHSEVTGHRFDVNHDGDVDSRDMDTLIHDILGTDYGDANLDGRVDESDTKVVRDHFFQFVTGWSQGDFNFDGRVDGSDFNIWNANRSESRRAKAVTAGL